MILDKAQISTPQGECARNIHEEVQTSVGLVSSFFYTIWESVMRILYLLTGIGMGMGHLTAILFSISFGSIYCTMHELSYLNKITLVSIWFRMVLTQITTHVYKDSLILTCPSNINI